jgi:hypothetical protein
VDRETPNVGCMRAIAPRELESRRTDLVEADGKPVRALLGISAFGAIGYVARQAGDLLIENHSEARSGFEELYVVLSGEVAFTVERDDGVNESVPMSSGQFTYVPPDRGRTAVSVFSDGPAMD